MTGESKLECTSRPGQEQGGGVGWHSLEFLQHKRQCEARWEIKPVKQSEANHGDFSVTCRGLLA